MRLNSTVMWTFGNFWLIADFIFLSGVISLKQKCNGNGRTRTGERCATRCAMFDQFYLTHSNTHARTQAHFHCACVHKHYVFCILVNTTDSSAPCEGEKRWLDIWTLLHRSIELLCDCGQPTAEDITSANMNDKDRFSAFLSLRRQVRRLLFPVPWKMLILQECCGCLLKLSSEAQKKKNLRKHKTNFYFWWLLSLRQFLGVSVCVRLGVQQTSLSDSTAGRPGLHSFLYLWMLSEFHFLFLFFFSRNSVGSCEFFFLLTSWVYHH